MPDAAPVDEEIVFVPQSDFSNYVPKIEEDIALKFG
jgi:hypothetical protein